MRAIATAHVRCVYRKFRVLLQREGFELSEKHARPKLRS
jgi:hypothetical protein